MQENEKKRNILLVIKENLGFEMIARTERDRYIEADKDTLFLSNVVWTNLISQMCTLNGNSEFSESSAII